MARRRVADRAAKEEGGALAHSVGIAQTSWSYRSSGRVLLHHHEFSWAQLVAPDHRQEYLRADEFSGHSCVGAALLLRTDCYDRPWLVIRSDKGAALAHGCSDACGVRGARVEHTGEQ